MSGQIPGARMSGPGWAGGQSPQNGGTFTNPYLGANGSPAAPTYSFSLATTTGMYSPGANTIGWAVGGTDFMRLNGGGLGVRGFIGIGPAPNTADVFWERDAADTFAQRRTTNAQTLRVYNTWTDASNYERVALTWTGNVCYLVPQAAGTGTARLLVLQTGITTVAALPAAATAINGRSMVSDATVTTFASIVAGGGANKVPVYSDGVNWLIG